MVSPFGMGSPRVKSKRRIVAEGGLSTISTGNRKAIQSQFVFVRRKIGARSQESLIASRIERDALWRRLRGEKRMNERKPWVVTTRFKDMVAFFVLLTLIYDAFIFTHPPPTDIPVPVILRVMVASAYLVFAPFVQAFISFVCLLLIALGGRFVRRHILKLKEQAEIKRKPWTVTTRFRDLFALWVLLSLLSCLDEIFLHPLPALSNPFFSAIDHVFAVVCAVTIGTIVFAFINWLLLLLTAWWGKVVFDVILSRTKRPIPSAATPTSGEHDVVAADQLGLDPNTITPVLGASSGRHVFYSPAAHIGRLRQWKIALSLAVVGALAAPFAFGTYKTRPTHLVWVPLTAHEKEQRAYYLDTDDCKSFDEGLSDPPNERFFCDVQNREGTIRYFKMYMEEQLEKGGRKKLLADLPEYWAMNVGVAAATAFSLFGLAYLIPMLIRGVAFLARRYWGWLNA
jgi:hypothetical protein